MSGELINQLDQEQLRKILSNWRMTPATFALKISRGHWIPSRHLQYISLRVALAVAKGNARIILSMPPRHGKSQLVSVYTPAWILEYLGKHSIILTSYGADLAEGFARQVRNIITDPMNEDLLRVKLGDTSRVEEFNTNLGGYMFAVGLGGAMTGRGANTLLIDDYIKEIKEALSPSYRDYVWNWYVTTALTRLEPKGNVIIVATRWHSDDLIGRLLRNERENWEYIELPAEALEFDQIGRSPGECLFPERYDHKALMKLKTSLGHIFYQALFQQRPVDETTRITDVTWIKIWPKFKKLPTDITMVRVWDLAATEGAGDWLTGTLCGYSMSTEDFFVLDVFRAQLAPGKVEDAVVAIAKEDGFSVSIRIEQEPGAAGKILVEHFTQNVLKDYKVTGVAVSKSKVVRAQPFLAAAEDGHVYLFENSSWNTLYSQEFEVFPSSNKTDHDDMIDTSAEGFTELTGKKTLSVSWGRADDNTTTTATTTPKRHNTQRSGINKSEQTKFASISVAPVRGASWGR